jgi:phosphoglycolate phosphatase
MPALFFDMDGTLTDSSPGIVRCVNHGLVTLGFAAVEEGRIRAMIGLPLTTIYASLIPGGDDALADRAVAAYRERFNDIGMFENSLFPGVVEGLEAFRAGGYSLAIVTSKVAVAAQRVIEHFQIAAHFQAVHGPALSERTSSKPDLLARALGQVSGDRSQMAMVGDRKEDMAAARAHGVRGLGALWGYGSAAELCEATWLAGSWPEMVRYILG